MKAKTYILGSPERRPTIPAITADPQPLGRGWLLAILASAASQTCVAVYLWWL